MRVVIRVTVDVTLGAGRMPIRFTDRVSDFYVDVTRLNVVPTVGADTAFGG